MKVLVLGCGPAGMIAAHAAALNGAEVEIWSRKRESIIYGNQYLHEPIPEISPPDPEAHLEHIFLGDPDVYAEKIYGEPGTDTYWQKAEGTNPPIWDLRSAYRKLWSLYKDRIRHVFISRSVIDGLEASSFDFIFNSIPLMNICSAPEVHKFNGYRVRVKINHEQERSRGCKVIYNGLKQDVWFRWSTIFGVDGGYEIPDRIAAPGSIRIRKPTSNDCDCHPNIIRVGRYGAWDMNLLTHSSIRLVTEALN